MRHGSSHWLITNCIYIMYPIELNCNKYFYFDFKYVIKFKINKEMQLKEEALKNCMHFNCVFVYEIKTSLKLNQFVYVISRVKR